MSVMPAQAYLNLPWSIRGPLEVMDEHGNRHYEMRISELPDFLVAGQTESEVLYAFGKALLTFLESYTNEGEEPPHPKGVAVEYVLPLGRAARHGKVDVTKKGETIGGNLIPSMAPSA